MKRKFSKLHSRFCRDVRGGVALMAGLTFPLLFLAVGGSVDYARATTNQTKVQSALDSTVLALTQKDLEMIDLQAEGEKTLQSFLASSQVEVNITGIAFATEGEAITGSVEVETPTFFLTFVGQPNMGGTAQASAIPPTRLPIEIALVLDVSGSMNTDLNGSPRIEHMKTAVNQMFDTLNEELPASTELSASLVPYSSSVNLSNYRAALKSGSMGGKNQNSEEVWAAERLVAANGNSYTLRDSPPSGSKIPFVLEDEMSSALPLERMVALSDDIDAIRTSVNNLTPNGWTAGHIGMSWGFYTLSSQWRTFWPDPPADAGEADKIIVLLSDGEFNTTYNIGDAADLFDGSATPSPEALQSQNDNQEEADAYFQDICDLARDQGVIIYAVALSLDAVAETKLEDCVGGNGGVYAADTAAELNDAFRNIALQLGQRRLTS